MSNVLKCSIYKKKKQRKKNIYSICVLYNLTISFPRKLNVRKAKLIKNESAYTRKSH